jgi:hypothetical protein
VHSQYRKARLLVFVMLIQPPAWNISVPTGQIFIKFSIWAFFKNQPRKFKLHYNLTLIMGTLHEDQYIFMIIAHSVLLRIKNVSDKSCRGNQDTHFMFNNFLSEIRTTYKIMWKNSALLNSCRWQGDSCTLHMSFKFPKKNLI